MSNIELLRTILQRLDILQRPKQESGDERPHDSSSSSTLSPLISLPDSLAFPKNARVWNKLANSSEFWAQLEKVKCYLEEDYACRKQLLVHRLDCTIESFKWKSSKQVDGTNTNPKKHAHQRGTINDQIDERYREMGSPSTNPKISMIDLLAIRETDCDKLLNCIVSSRNVDCKVAYKRNKQQGESELVNLKQIIIGDVPDRGGRTDEARPPTRESFSQQRRFRGRR